MSKEHLGEERPRQDGPKHRLWLWAIYWARPVGSPSQRCLLGFPDSFRVVDLWTSACQRNKTQTRMTGEMINESTDPDKSEKH